MSTYSTCKSYLTGCCNGWSTPSLNSVTFQKMILLCSQSKFVVSLLQHSSEEFSATCCFVRECSLKLFSNTLCFTTPNYGKVKWRLQRLIVSPSVLICFAGIRADWHALLIKSMLVDYDHKKQFAVQFIKVRPASTSFPLFQLFNSYSLNPALLMRPDCISRGISLFCEGSTCICVGCE